MDRHGRIHRQRVKFPWNVGEVLNYTGLQPQICSSLWRCSVSRSVRFWFYVETPHRTLIHLTFLGNVYTCIVTTPNIRSNNADRSKSKGGRVWIWPAFDTSFSESTPVCVVQVCLSFLGFITSAWAAHFSYIPESNRRHTVSQNRAFIGPFSDTFWGRRLRH
jgi:hypothetical protein